LKNITMIIIITAQTGYTYRGYYMAMQRYEISL